ncbi:flagellin protein [Halorhabdus tiamatea SARL4B]|uniref:Flagella-related protein FlaF n=1 Tax=Halorhabdus tiamatea SARL4B TaxID=1033806 RepID=F7PIY3_9EURY|nr:flagellin [Halorhabdus tiamatea]ERJ05916.1 flagellin protein [Halorhabdus tiamatea SARL4B]CCQ32949.1 flagella-related protein FlaF [Halorhabdus tiamatea SARL4B]
MGFSVSGSAAILLVAFFVAFGTFYSAASNSMETVNEARSAAQDDLLTQQNTAINLTDVTVAFNVSGNQRYYVNATVENTGATGLDVEDTDFLLDGRLQTSFLDRAVDGDSSTDVWATGQRLTANMTTDTQPDRLKVVSGPGVADAEVGLSG